MFEVTGPFKRHEASHGSAVNAPTSTVFAGFVALIQIEILGEYLLLRRLSNRLSSSIIFRSAANSIRPLFNTGIKFK